MNILVNRHRKSTKIRKKIKQLNIVRLSVHRTPRHIYAQVIGIDGKVLASASSLEKAIKTELNLKENFNSGKKVPQGEHESSSLLKKVSQDEHESSSSAIEVSQAGHGGSCSNKIKIARLVGKLIAERCHGKVIKVAFDRSGFKYHGRVKALADAAREHGLSF